ncbi:ImmA/IrrE family metallo-endopeptidase, partial [Escherichia coli]|uniref:ImmA/IrrE family metallo-endopeptidase n=1 Tax=Escherichia coli TaxID=562 RepID=UPI002FBE81F2
LAHLWLGVDGVSGWDTEKNIESFCNKVAAEILMPDNLFKSFWLNASSDNNYYRVKEVSKLFKVSDFACAIKALQLDLIERNTLEIT